METFDARDAEILKEREAGFNRVQGPRVGDFLRTPEGYLRFTHDWGNGIQTTCRPGHPCSGDGSFYLGTDGYVSFSGWLDPSIDKAKLHQTEETQDGSFWFFHHDSWGADRDVSFKIPCRVFELVTVKRTWTKVGEEFTGEHAKREQIAGAIERMEWQEIPKGGSLTLGMMPGEGIKAAIRELHIPKVSHVAVSNELAPYGLYGIRGHYKNGDANVFIVDRGSDMLPVCSDFTAK